jgi:hypothetical protein
MHSKNGTRHLATLKVRPATQAYRLRQLAQHTCTCTCLHACKTMRYALQGSHHNPKTLQKLHKGQQRSLHDLKGYHNTRCMNIIDQLT